MIGSRDAGRDRTGRAQQMRTWNLSALWRIPTRGGRIWLKAVPDFFAHEGAVIDWIGAPVAPRLIDFDPGRALLVDIEGPTNHEVRDAGRAVADGRAADRSPARALDRLHELIALGVPDRRLSTVVDRAAAVLEQWGSAIEQSERRSLEAVVAGLPARVAAIVDCGVPDTLVHGDFHAGNVAGRPGDYVILDWGDSFVGHPLLDELAFVERLPPAVQIAARGWFVDAWRRTVPGCRARPRDRAARTAGLPRGGGHVRPLLRRHRTRRADLPRFGRDPDAPPSGGVGTLRCR